MATDNDILILQADMESMQKEIQDHRLELSLLRKRLDRAEKLIRELSRFSDALHDAICPDADDC